MPISTVLCTTHALSFQTNSKMQNCNFKVILAILFLSQNFKHMFFPLSNLTVALHSSNNLLIPFNKYTNETSRRVSGRLTYYQVLNHYVVTSSASRGLAMWSYPALDSEGTVLSLFWPLSSQTLCSRNCSFHSTVLCWSGNFTSW